MQYYRTVTQSCSKLRGVARTALKGNWKQVVLFMALYYLLVSGVSMVLDIFFHTTQVVPADELAGAAGPVSVDLGYGGTIYEFFIGGPAAWSLSKFMLDFFRTREKDYTTLFEGFSFFAKSFSLMILMSVRILLWSLLFVIPGIIASFRYSQAYYIMVDHPEYTPGQCIRESCAMMNGNKAKLLLLQFSFIGWYILASIPTAFYDGGTDNIGSVAIVLLLSVPGMIVDVYLNVALTAFYEIAADNLIVAESDEYVENRWDDHNNM